MEELTQEQKKLFNKIIKNIKDENSIQQLEQLLDSIENNTIEQALENIGKINAMYNGQDDKMSVEEMVEDIKTFRKDIDEIYDKIFDIKSDDENVENKSSALNAIKEAERYADQMQNDYMRFYDQEDSQGNVTQGIISKLNQACETIKENEGKIKEFEKFYDKIFVGIEADENGRGGQLSLEKHLSDKKQDLEDCLNKYTDKLENLYEEKETKIEQLLPGATSAGLSVAYKDEKENYQRNVTLWNWFFVGSIVVFIIVFGIYLYFSFQDNFTYISFFRALPFWIFSGFFTYYSTKQIAEYKRMASEYAHKQRLNQTYKGYETQIKETDDEELKKQLLRIMLDSAELNPSKTLGGKGEIPSLSALEKIIDILPLESLSKLQTYIKGKINKE